MIGIWRWFFTNKLFLLAPVSVMAVYAHPIEHIISNIFPVTLGLALLKAPMSTAWVVFTTTQLATLGDHSGLNLKFKKII